MLRITLISVLLLVALALLPGQALPEKGVLPMQNFTPEQFGDVGKAWAIQSADNGLVYFATDNGLLEFDGAEWRLIPGSKGATRSLFLANDSTLYAGADQDFGQWRMDSAQRPAF
ncbi:MAG: hypothetical protein AAF597_18670, partial [Bacteroidota bacterium]